MSGVVMTAREAGLLANGLGGKSIIEAAEDEGSLTDTFRKSVAESHKARIGKLYLGRTNPGWPAHALNLGTEVESIEGEFAKRSAELADVEFVGNDLVSSAQQLKTAIRRMDDVAGILVVNLSLGTGGWIRKLADLGVPITMFSPPYAGHEWHTIASMQRQAQKIDIYPSSNYEDLVTAIRPIRAIHRLRTAKILYPANGSPVSSFVEAIRKKIGPAFEEVTGADLASEKKRWKDKADLESTITAMIFEYLTDEPGFATDPDFDVSSGTVIHNICVTPIPTNGSGRNRSREPLHPQVENSNNALLQAGIKKGQPVTMARLIGTDVMLFSTGKILETSSLNRDCCAKITTTVKNPEKRFENWSRGLRRVLLHGDHSHAIHRLARFLDFQVVEEGVDNLDAVEGLEWNPTVHA